MSTTDSYFDGGVFGLIGINLLSALLILVTIGFGLPWAITIRQNWITKHTVVEGNRLRFEGTGLGLFGTWIKIWLLTIITLGIYGFWAGIAVKKWTVKNTRFAA